MTYPPDPYQPPQPYGQPSTPYGPSYGAQPVQPHGAEPIPPYGAQPVPPYGESPVQPYGTQSAPPFGAQSAPPFGAQPVPPYGAQPVPPDGVGAAYKGGPGHYGQAYPGYRPYGTSTNTLAILALVFAFLFPIAGIVMGHLARGQIARTGEEGDVLAVVALWFGYALLAISVLFCGFYGVLMVWSFDQATSTTGGVTV